MSSKRLVSGLPLNYYRHLCLHGINPSQALAELYVIDGQYEKAFSLYADVSGF